MAVGSGRGRGELRARLGSAGPDLPCLRPSLQVLEYNLVGGKHQRGLLVLVAFRALVEPKKQDAASVHRALIVGWCVEMVSHAEGPGRRGSPEWGALHGAGLTNAGTSLASRCLVHLQTTCGPGLWSWAQRCQQSSEQSDSPSRRLVLSRD